METKVWRYPEREDFGPGPWVDEPDKKQWQDPETGLPCLIVRNRLMGHLCGYVGVAPGHFYHGRDYETVEVGVHGDLTFAGPCTEDRAHICHEPGEGEEENVWWFGFDCAHAWDVMPMLQKQHPEMDIEGETYKDFSFVEAECRALARQLYRMGGES